MKAILSTILLVSGIFGLSFGQAKQESTKRVILPNIRLVRCVTSDCFQLLQDNPPRPGDVHPEHIDVAFLDRWCPFGLTATYDKAVPFEDLKNALEKQFGKGTSESWPDGPVLTWNVESAHLTIDLEVADKRIAQNRHIEEGARTVHYSDMSGKLCPAR